ncbi:hydroxyisourate hydrolase [Myceligenerans xiligouense]|uniref:5-hydroxyisourate hydrolase n=1 Tax=Myceligenerans xiligouense TaxID=253184 RepID=A0A3N4YHP2_9MICO|nr:hydroxyisourate hydrolase [Myceligenerans xiligouense]RPF20629.1 5-hydroxyisourate hydrolase [Myceligenerans xiligouense]
MTTASTHVLDAARGLPAAGMRAALTGPLPVPPPDDATGDGPSPDHERAPRPPSDTAAEPGGSLPAAAEPEHRTATTDDDGRIAWGDLPGPGTYTLELATGDWFAAQDRDTFYPRVVLEVALGTAHTHVALLLSPFAYTTYRGS